MGQLSEAFLVFRSLPYSNFVAEATKQSVRAQICPHELETHTV
jgi:hypothetical protein